MNYFVFALTLVLPAVFASPLFGGGLEANIGINNDLHVGADVDVGLVHGHDQSSEDCNDSTTTPTNHYTSPTWTIPTPTTIIPYTTPTWTVPTHTTEDCDETTTTTDHYPTWTPTTTTYWTPPPTTSPCEDDERPMTTHGADVVTDVGVNAGLKAVSGTGGGVEVDAGADAHLGI
ncbi:hypothetical protein PQX77_016661 [Marasmius sp. AFHP31]|nr:hypothetical protein PQX77_016661 [Marasmius sp. AFHP31]